MLRLENFLTRNGHPHRALDSGTDGCAQTLLERFAIQPEHLPIVLCPGGADPAQSQRRRAGALHRPAASRSIPTRVYDTAIVGAGPGRAGGGGLCRLGRAFDPGAGLPQLRRPGGRLVAHRELPGLSHRHLRPGADGARLQPGAEIRRRDRHSRRGARPGPTGQRARFQLTLGNGETVQARSVVLASGARYRRLDIDNLSEFEGTCVHYWASAVETRLCAGQEVALTGAGNSAGQAVVFLARQGEEALDGGARQGPGRHHVAISGRPHPRPAQCRSADPHRDLRPGRRRGRAEARALAATATAAKKTACDISHVFSFIGADPNTDWLDGCGVAAGRQGLCHHRRGRRPSRWRPAATASSRWAMCAAARSSGWRRRWAKARPWCRPSMPMLARQRERAGQKEAAE